jgi:hypothetical protein
VLDQQRDLLELDEQSETVAPVLIPEADAADLYEQAQTVAIDDEDEEPHD